MDSQVLSLDFLFLEFNYGKSIKQGKVTYKAPKCMPNPCFYEHWLN